MTHQKFQKLSEQSGMERVLDEHASEYGSEDSEYPELQKFAELIVEECCRVIEAHYEPVYDGKILLMHFGIGAQGSEHE